MNYLIDTNALSELRRKAPDANVVAWFAKRPPVTLYLSVLTLGEIRKGVEGAADTARRQALMDWLETDLPLFFTGRILGVDTAVAERWGRLVAAAGHRQPAGRHGTDTRFGAGHAQRQRLCGAAGAGVQSVV